ncbi:hypothetical protein Ahy_A02g008209 isoform A [Arachis hypogaea]|uniref:Aminotransferase-like plant mobile domain-containing protein n=1 Tax=Arachis hypogaea TaxID=3818 RepID=A0A445EEP6_ARAHY|nr:hypothetical protein Ahy_A02g008209 isoform A [Arachis hypogaea]
MDVPFPMLCDTTPSRTSPAILLCWYLEYTRGFLSGVHLSDKFICTLWLRGNCLVSDQHEQRVLQWCQELDQLLWNEFTWMLYDDPAPHDICPEEAEWGTWMSVVPLVCFNIVEFYHANWVKRQFNGEQLMPGDPINVDKFLTTIGQGKDVWWPTNLHE